MYMQIIDETSDADAYYDDSETQYVPMRRGYMRSSPKKKQKGMKTYTVTKCSVSREPNFSIL